MAQPFAPKETETFLALWAQQEGRCALCGEPMPRHRFETAHRTLWAKRRPTLDHIRPKSRGGQDRLENLQLAHAQCNKIKGNTL